jgi:hypothetical protein
VVLAVISVLLFALSFRLLTGLFRRRNYCAAANGTRLSANWPAHGMNSMSPSWGTSGGSRFVRIAIGPPPKPDDGPTLVVVGVKARKATCPGSEGTPERSYFDREMCPRLSGETSEDATVSSLSTVSASCPTRKPDLECRSAKAYGPYSPYQRLLLSPELAEAKASARAALGAARHRGDLGGCPDAAGVPSERA